MKLIIKVNTEKLWDNLPEQELVIEKPGDPQLGGYQIYSVAENYVIQELRKYLTGCVTFEQVEE